MQPLSKTALGVTAGAAAMILLEGHARAAVTRMRRVLARKPGAENAIEGAVRDKLVRLTPHGRAVHPSVDHGCVVLTGDVLTEERMKHAAEFLAKTDLKIAEISERVGYRSEAAFHHRFTSFFGMSPGQLRRHRQQLRPKLPAFELLNSG